MTTLDHWLWCGLPPYIVVASGEPGRDHGLRPSVSKPYFLQPFDPTIEPMKGPSLLEKRRWSFCGRNGPRARSRNSPSLGTRRTSRELASALKKKIKKSLWSCPTRLRRGWKPIPTGPIRPDAARDFNALTSPFSLEVRAISDPVSAGDLNMVHGDGAGVHIQVFRERQYPKNSKGQADQGSAQGGP